MNPYKIAAIIICVFVAILGMSFGLLQLPIYSIPQEGWHCNEKLPEPLVITACIASFFFSFLTLAFLIWLYIVTNEQIMQAQGDVKKGLFKLMDMVLRTVKPDELRQQAFPSSHESVSKIRKRPASGSRIS